MRALLDPFSAEIFLLDAAISQELDTLPASLQPVAAYIAALPGKRIRPFICINVARCLGCAGDTVYPLAAALEILHCATLLHDDILDEAHTRRGALAAHLQFSNKLAVLAGDAMFALAGDMVARYERPGLVSIFSAAIRRTAEGQALEFSRLFDQQIDEAHYLSIISGKTAAMFEAAALAGAELAGAPARERAAAAGFGFNFGLAFQVMDDLLDFFPASNTGKPQGGDMREGKLTLPLICWLAASPLEARLDFLDKFSQKTLCSADAAALCAQIQSRGLINTIKLQAETYAQRASNHLKELPLNQFHGTLLTLTRSLPQTTEGLVR